MLQSALFRQKTRQTLAENSQKQLSPCKANIDKSNLQTYDLMLCTLKRILKG